MKRLLAALAIATIFAGCASHTLVPDEDRARLERQLPGRTFYLRHSMYVGPFWSETNKLFVSDGVPDEIPWVVNPAGEPIVPGAPTRVLPAGTRVRVVSLDLPTGYEVTVRNPFTPRYNPWLYVEVEGMKSVATPVLLLRRDLRTSDQVMEDLERFLSPTDLTPALAQLDPEVRKAVNEKRLVEGMPAEAVAMAWGYPERKTMAPSPEGRREEWVWPFDKRAATILDGKLVSWKGEGARLALE